MVFPVSCLMRRAWLLMSTRRFAPNISSAFNIWQIPISVQRAGHALNRRFEQKVSLSTSSGRNQSLRRLRSRTLPKRRYKPRKAQDIEALKVDDATRNKLLCIQYLRQLLRECTYLPDPASRIWMKTHILKRYRANQHVPESMREPLDEIDEDIVDETPPEHLFFRKIMPAFELSDNRVSEAEEVSPEADMEFFDTDREMIGLDHESIETDLESTGTDKEDQKIQAITWESRLRKLLKDARKGIITLFRANSGNLDQTRKILQITYGRRGPRRHELLQAVRGDTIGGESDWFKQEIKISKLKVRPENVKSFPVISMKLDALLRSQHHERLRNDVRTELKQLHLQLSPKNMWGKPMAQKRIRSAVQKWYATALSRVHAPLPDNEWNRLARLASGEDKWAGPVTRRTAAEPVIMDYEDGLDHTSLRKSAIPGRWKLVQRLHRLKADAERLEIRIDRILTEIEGTIEVCELEIKTGKVKTDVEDRNLQRARFHTRLAAVRTKTSKLKLEFDFMQIEGVQPFITELEALLGTIRGTKGLQRGREHASKVLTPRFMRRRYEEIFGICPRMTWDHEKERWNTEWGTVSFKGLKKIRKQQARDATEGAE